MNGLAPALQRSLDESLATLTPAQRDAVEHVDGPLLTLAGPGSGKTRVVTHRIANLLAKGVRPDQIVAMTFTNKAAAEMRTRLERILPPSAGSGRVWMGTFHRFCAYELRRNASLVGLSENYSIYDMPDQKRAFKHAIAAADVSTSHASPDQIASTISRAKSRLITPDMMQGHAMTPIESIAARVYPHYQQTLLRSNAVDFDDLLLHVAMLLRGNPHVRSQWDARYRYILVDEYQDTNLAQYAIVRALSIDHPNLAVTGDPDQSIYGWRGADLNNILDFEKDYPNVKTVRLEKNYRSTPNILRVADELIRHNRLRKPKELFTDNDEAEKVVLRLYNDGREEANAIVDEIAAAVAAGEVKADQVAIFCRMNALTRSLEQAMRNRGVPYQIINAVEFYQRKEIKDLIAYLHLINNPSNDVAFGRVINTPTRGIGDKTIAKIQDFADQKGIPMLAAARQAASIPSLSKRAVTMVSKFIAIYERLEQKITEPLEDVISHLLIETNYRAYLEKTMAEKEDANPMLNVDELLAGAADFDRQHPDDRSLDLYLEQIALVSDTDKLDQDAARVTMMTLHASKGLEFPWVYVIAVEDDLIPHGRSKETEREIEEERRLLFVGITRAEKRLQLSYCKRRSIRGDLRPVVPSPFLAELPMIDIHHVEPSDDADFVDPDCFDQSYPDAWDEEPAIQIFGDQTPADPGQPRMVINDGDVTAEINIENSSIGNSGIENAMFPADQAPGIDKLKRPPKKKQKKIPLALQTAAEMLNAGQTPIAAFREGSLVRHEEYGQGEIISVDGRGIKRMAKIRFSGCEKSFRLAHSQLKLVEHP